MGHRSEVARASGFTLFELLVTLVVLAVAVAVVAPTIGRATETVRARAEVAAFSALLRHAREQAIVTRERRVVSVEPLDRRVTLATPDGVREVRTLSPRLQIEAVSPTALGVRFDPEGTSTGGAFRVTAGTVRYRVTVDAVTGRVRSERE